MPFSWVGAKRFLCGPVMSGNAARTFRLHRAYAVLDGLAGGILLNAPVMAIKGLQAPTWQLPLRELCVGVGMIATLYLGGRMASRPKMPFVFIPGMLTGVCSLLMATATGSAFWFLALLGLSAMFEIVTRPATAAVLRVNYPVEHRGHAVGEVRKWSSLAFLASGLATAWLLQWVPRDGAAAIQSVLSWASPLCQWSTDHLPQMLWALAGALSLASFLCFRQIRVDEAIEPLPVRRPGIAKAFCDTLAVIVRDGRFRRCLAGCFVEGFCQMLYASLIWAFLSRDLGFGYVGCFGFYYALPALVAFATTGALGRVFDRSNPWACWAWVRVLWGLDAWLLAATPWCAALFPPLLFVLPVLGRLVRGSVQGGWWILWWQIGVTHFAPPGEDTSRYMGVMVFLNGATRLLASAAGILLTMQGVPVVALLAIGGLGVVLAGAYSFWQAARERRQHAPDTMAAFEHQFGPASRRSDATDLAGAAGMAPDTATGERAP